MSEMKRVHFRCFINYAFYIIMNYILNPLLGLSFFFGDSLKL